MNDRQLALFIKEAFALERWGENAVKVSNPVLRQAIQQIQALITGRLPEEGLLRERALRDMLPAMRRALAPYNQALADALAVQMTTNVQPIVDAAMGMLQRAGAVVAPVFRVGAVADSVRLVLNTKVNGTTLRKLFNVDGESVESIWTRQNINIIQSEVRKGIVDGTLTKDIARNIAGPNAERRIRAQARAVARTAIQDFNHQVHEDVWAANPESLEGLQWEWVAMFDSRTCPTCAPLDGDRKKDRKDFDPTWPAHVNCRCRVVPVDPADPEDIRTGIQISPEKFEGDGAYKTKVKVKGKKFYRKAVEIKKKGADYADYLASSERVTQVQFFGGGKLGRERADWFRKAVDRKLLTPQVALQKLLVGPAENRGFRVEMPPLRR